MIIVQRQRVATLVIAACAAWSVLESAAWAGIGPQPRGQQPAAAPLERDSTATAIETIEYLIELSAQGSNCHGEVILVAAPPMRRSNVPAMAKAPGSTRGTSPNGATSPYQNYNPSTTTTNPPGIGLQRPAAPNRLNEHGISTGRDSRPDLAALHPKILRVLQNYYPRRLNTREHDCWEAMHALIGYGLDSELHRDGPGGKRVNTAGWLCFNGSCMNHRLLYVENGRIMARQGVGVQGHYGQFLAILAQSHMPLSYPMKAENQDFTVGDLLDSEKFTCQSNSELTFKLIAITHYADDLNETWKNRTGEVWSVEKLVKEEIAAPIRGAACGGTHRLMGLAHAVRRREQLEQPIDGQFARAKKYLQDYHQYTLSLQNRDGSFSTEWFRGPGSRPDLGRRLQTTGHILEWLVYSLPADELTQPRVVQAVNYLTGIMLANPDRAWEVGPLGHALHALMLYDARVYRANEPRELETADKGTVSLDAEAAKPPTPKRPMQGDDESEPAKTEAPVSGSSLKREMPTKTSDRTGGDKKIRLNSFEVIE